MDSLLNYRGEELPDRQSFLLQLRDAFIDACCNPQNITVFDAMLSHIEPTIEYIGGLPVSYHPANNYKLIRYFDTKQAVVNNYVISDVRITARLRIGFINPAELSYHNFENILSLRHTFEYCALTNFKEEYPHIYTFSYSNTNELLDIDRSNIYIPQYGNLRGGKRVIFNSRSLGDQLTKAIGRLGVFSDFKFVNPVFRYNKFSPSDRKFISHYDTPFYDSRNHHCSKYTIIIYLTQPATPTQVPLVIEGKEIRLDIFNGVIFDQRFKHEGNSYSDNDKIFIRSELIFEDRELQHDQTVAKCFNISCYNVLQAKVHPEVDKYLNDCFNKVTQMRFGILPSTEKFRSPLYKCTYKSTSIERCKFDGGSIYITNGHDYWFSNYNINEQILKQLAIMIIRDYFKGQKNTFNTKYETLLQNATFDEQLTRVHTIFNKKYSYSACFHHTIFDKQYSLSDANVEHTLVDSNKLTRSQLRRHPVVVQFFKSEFKKSHHFRYSAIKIINEDEASSDSDDSRSNTHYDRNEIIINLQDIDIQPDKITFKNTGVFNRINFAASYSEYESDVELDLNVTEEQICGYNFPPIYYQINPKYYHFTIDMFNSNFVFPIDDTRKILGGAKIDD